MDILDSLEDLESDETEDDLDSELDDELDELDLSDDDDELSIDDELELISDDDLAIEMSEEKAREITDGIRAAASATYVLLSQAHEGKAHKALGYGTWADYVNKEFEMSSARSYQLLDLSKAIKLIEEASPEGTAVKLTEAQARDIKRELPKITDQIREETKDLEPEEAKDRVGQIIDDVREQKRLDDEAIAAREKSVQEAHEQGRRDGLEAAADAMLEADASGTMGSRADDEYVEVQVEGDGSESHSPQDAMDLYNFFNVLGSISSLPEPDDFVEIIPDKRSEEINNQLNKATAWLNRFSTLWEEKNY